MLIISFSETDTKLIIPIRENWILRLAGWKKEKKSLRNVKWHLILRIAGFCIIFLRVHLLEHVIRPHFIL